MERKSCLLLVFIFSVLSACGGGSSSGPPAQVDLPDVSADPVPTTTPGEFATQCLGNVEVRRNGTALVQNICGFSINVGQMNSRFPGPPPITEIAPGQIAAVTLADDSLSIGFGACRVPSIPEPAEEAGFFSCSDVATQAKEQSKVKIPTRIRTISVTL